MGALAKARRLASQNSAQAVSVARALRTAAGGEAAQPAFGTAEMTAAINQITDVVEALGAIRDVLRVLAETVIKASAETDDALRALLSEDYDDNRRRVADVLAAQSEKVLALLGPDASAHRLPLKSGGEYYIAAFPVSVDSGSLDLPPPSDGFSSQREIALIMEKVDSAISRLDRAAKIYNQDKAFLSARVD